MRRLAGSVLVLAVLGCGNAAATRAQRPVVLRSGSQLFVDDYLIARRTGVARVVESPVPRGEPIVTGRDDANSTPYVSVLRRPSGFALWFDRGFDEPGPLRSHIGYLESGDGLVWRRPARQLTDPAPITFGVTVVDTATGARPLRLAWWHDGAMWLAQSSDGQQWTDARPVLPGVRDIVSIARDPARRQWVATFKLESTRDDKNPAYRRLVGQSTSRDLEHWTAPRVIFAPDGLDPPRLEFYGLGGVIERGGLLIGLLRVLRDDQPADPGGEPNGIGYTVLAWSRDGEHWHRDRQPFLDRDVRPGSWDHAMAWADAQVTIGGRTLIYYGGYDQGHKTNRYTGRQLGVATMRADRYVARRANARGTLVTRLIAWRGGRVRLNARVDGRLVVSILDADGRRVTGCSLRAGGTNVGCGRSVPRGRAVRIRFVLERASVYGFSAARGD